MARYLALAWAFFRGMPYRRVERSHTLQSKEGKPVRVRGAFFEHNLPRPDRIAAALRTYAGDFLVRFARPEELELALAAWLADPRGGMPETDAALRLRVHDALRETLIQNWLDEDGRVHAARFVVDQAHGTDLDVLAARVSLTRVMDFARRGADDREVPRWCLPAFLGNSGLAAGGAVDKLVTEGRGRTAPRARQRGRAW